MGSYQRILLAFDFIKDDDESVIEKAVELVKESQAELSVVHAIEYPVPVIAPLPGLFEAMELAAKEHLAQLGERLHIPSERQLLVVGQAKRAILEVAERLKVDLIVVGSHGRHGISTWLLGSTAQSIIQYALCDVLVVRLKNSKLTHASI